MFSKLTATLLLLGITYACNQPSITATVARPQYQTDGAIMLNGSGFSALTTYNVGIFRNGAPRIIGTVQSDTAGNIDNVKVEYSCQTELNGILNVEVLPQNSGVELAQTTTNQNTCF